ncbi:MAG: glycoside hydrolase family 71/99-like protein [Mariniblastus sp.]|nr:glycoside hydrolase family 71/99-like protein [Mariniblastus sp.]
MNFKTADRLVAVFSVLVFALATAKTGTAQTDGDLKTGPPVLAHYMPWYGSKSVSGAWGWHWTMNHFDPEKVDETGRRQIASQYYPLIGPYDSSDPHALECQVQLMKLSGIDGVVIDWYGIEEHWDYGINHRNTILMVEKIKKAGLKFAICYEDQTIQPLLDAKKIKTGGEVAHGRKVLAWLEENWFQDQAYVKVRGNPVLMVFGPMRFKQADWNSMTKSMTPKPIIFGLPHLSAETGGNAYGWPPVNGGQETSPTAWKNYLDDLYGRAQNNTRVGGIVFPQFHDIYEQAKNKPSFGSLNARGGKTFDETLDRGLRSQSEFVQIATWNDYGEGTMIEPTREFGYRYLEKLHAKLNSRAKTDSELNDLRLPVELYRARKNAAGDGRALAELTKVSDLIFARKYQLARERLVRMLPDSQGQRKQE